MQREHLEGAQQLDVFVKNRGNQVREPVTACVVDLRRTQRTGCVMSVRCHATSVAESTPDA